MDDFSRAAVQQGHTHRWPCGVPADSSEVELTLSSDGVVALLSSQHARSLAAAAPRVNSGARSADDGRAYGTALAGALLATTGVPEQRTMSDDAKRQWIVGLAGTRPLAELAATAPHGFRRRALFDALATHRVPLGRAAWYVRVVCLNQLRSQGAAAGDAAAAAGVAAERSRAWTADLCENLTQVLPDALASLADDEGDTEGAAPVQRLQLAVRLAAWTAGEGLLYAPDLLEWVASNATRQGPDAVRALAPLVAAVAAGTAVAPQPVARLLQVARRAAAAGDAHAATALRAMAAEVLALAPHLCCGLQDAAALVQPAPTSASVDLSCEPTTARALEALARLRDASARLAGAASSAPSFSAELVVHAALDAAVLSGDVDAACNAVLAAGPSPRGHVALLCEWAASEPWGPADQSDGVALLPARMLLAIALLQRISKRLTDGAAPASALPPLHALFMAWAAEEVQHVQPRAGRACTLFAAAVAARVVSAPAFVGFAVAEGVHSRSAGTQLLLAALPVPERDNSAETQRFSVERTALLTAFDEQHPAKRQRSSNGGQASAVPQHAGASLLPLQAAIQQLLQFPSAKAAQDSADDVTVAQAVADVVGLLPQARSRMASWLDASVRLAAQPSQAGGRPYLNGQRLSAVVALMAAADGHLRLLELLALLLRAGAVPWGAASAALRSLAGMLPVTGTLPRVLDVLAECADELPAADPADARSRRVPAAAASLLAWLLSRCASNCHHARTWRAAAMKRYPGLARHPCVVTVVGGAAAPQRPSLTVLPPLQQAPAVDEQLSRLQLDGSADAWAMAAELARVAAAPEDLSHAACGVVLATQRVHAASAVAPSNGALVLSRLMELVGGDTDERWNVAASAVALGITRALSASLTGGALSANHTCATVLAACMAEGVICFERAVAALLPVPVPTDSTAATWSSCAVLLLGRSEHCALAAAQSSADASALLLLLEAAAQAEAHRALRAVADNAVLRRALLSHLLSAGARHGSQHTATVMRVLCTGRYAPDSPPAPAVAAAADVLTAVRHPGALRLAVAEARVRLEATRNEKSGAQAVLAALAAAPDAAPALAACVDDLGSAVRTELLYQVRTLLVSAELLRGSGSLRASLLSARGDASAEDREWHALHPCALERGLTALVHACLAHEDTSGDARHTFAAALAQQLKAQPEAFKPSPSCGEADAAAAQCAVWLRLHLLLPLLPVVLGEGQKAGRRSLRETLAAALLQLLALPALRADPGELRGPYAPAAVVEEADAGESLLQRTMLIIQVLLAGVWPTWLPEALRPAAVPAANADALLRLQAEADALQLPADVRASLAGALGAAGRAYAVAELPPAAPLGDADVAEAGDPWLLFEDAGGAWDANADASRASTLLAGAIRVRRM